MSQSQVPTAPNLDILSETVTDTGAAAPSATAQMQAMLGELDKDAAQSGLIIGSASRSSPAERLRKTLVEFKRGLWSQPPGQLGGVISTIDNFLTYFSGDEAIPPTVNGGIPCLDSVDQASSRSESAAFLL